MRTFKELNVGGDIFIMSVNLGSSSFLGSNDQYGNVHHSSIVRVIKVTQVELKNGKIIINNGTYSALVSIPEDYSSKSVFEKNGNVYFSDEKEYHSLVKSKVLDEIEKTEKSIETHRINSIKRVQDLRKSYYKFLNKTV